MEMTEQERLEFKEFKAAKAKKEAEERKKTERKTYTQIVDEMLGDVVPRLIGTSNMIAGAKADVVSELGKALELKRDIFKVRDNKMSHTFTSSDGKYRIIFGEYADAVFLDTVNEGVAIVKEYISSLAKDDDSKMIVNAILKLLAKDKTGNLQPSRVLQLRAMAEESNNDRFREGVRVIEESYSPQAGKRYIRAEYRDDVSQGWKTIPLGMTEA